MTGMKAVLLAVITFTSIMAQAQSTIYITANGETRTATLAGNAASETLLRMLADGPVSIDMHDYGGWEKVGNLPRPLPASDSRITAQPGDIMLYQGDQIVIFYGDNSWSYTRLGKIDGATATNIRSWLGNASVLATLSLSASSGIDDAMAGYNTEKRVYDLMGRPVALRPLPPGLYIIDGKKVTVR